MNEESLDIVNITQELYNGSRRLALGSEKIFELAKEMAESEMEYIKALSTEKIRLRTEGMSVGLIDDIAKGNIADTKFKRDLAEARYTAGRDRLKAIAAELNALQSILRIQKEI